MYIHFFLSKGEANKSKDFLLLSVTQKGKKALDIKKFFSLVLLPDHCIIICRCQTVLVILGSAVLTASTP